jgi:hypothetical protein
MIKKSDTFIALWSENYKKTVAGARMSLNMRVIVNIKNKNRIELF